MRHIYKNKPTQERPPADWVEVRPGVFVLGTEILERDQQGRGWNSTFRYESRSKVSCKAASMSQVPLEFCLQNAERRLEEQRYEATLRLARNDVRQGNYRATWGTLFIALHKRDKRDIAAEYRALRKEPIPQWVKDHNAAAHNVRVRGTSQPVVSWTSSPLELIGTTNPNTFAHTIKLNCGHSVVRLARRDAKFKFCFCPHKCPRVATQVVKCA